MGQASFLDQSLFSELAAQAAANPRGRQHHNFHQMEEPCHRMPWRCNLLPTYPPIAI